MNGTTINGIFVDYRDYISTYGRTPKGRGGWAFHTGDAQDYYNMIWATGTFTYAKKLAAKEAKRRGKYRIYVCS
jgi:hypothetical protein